MIVPVFLPHLGCRQRCIYCNQHHITGKNGKQDAKETIRKALDPVKARAEVALYGGNPFGLGTDGLARLFSLFEGYREKISSMRLSTEPIVPDARTIDLLKEHKVTTVELGIPAFSDEMLRALGRHHTLEDLFKTHEALIRAGFTVGFQLMVGLPGETAQDIRSTVQQVIRLSPAFVRVYPLVVLRDTLLYTAFQEKSFTPLSLAEAVRRALFIYLQAETHGIRVIKMGLTDNEFLKGEIVAGPYHPAFGYLVRAEGFYLAVSRVCKQHGLSGQITLLLNGKDVPHLTGYRRSNLKRFEEQGLHIEWREQESTPPRQFEILIGHGRSDSGASCKDNEGIRVKANWHLEAIAMLPF